VSCDIDRPRRSTPTSIVTGPGRTCAAYTVVTERRHCAGASSSACIARNATAVAKPPCGLIGAHH
jgi:hypothetical protein